MDFKWRPDRDTNPRFEVISLKRQAEIDATKRSEEEELAKQFHRPISSVEVLNEADELDMKQQNPNESANVTRRRHKLLDVNALEEIMGFDDRRKEHTIVRALDISGRAYTGVRTDHLLGFSGIRELNANENHMNVHQFVQLGGLEVLTLACNAIRQLESLRYDKDFQSLRVLDLSFNRLGNSAMASLSGLPKLEVLDLMNNNITAIPLDSVCINRDKTRIGFQSLLVLSLERNQLKSTEESMKSLGLMPRLRNLNLDGNLLHTFSMFVSRRPPQAITEQALSLPPSQPTKINDNSSKSGGLDTAITGAEEDKTETQLDPAAPTEVTDAATREAEYEAFLKSRIPEDPIAVRTVFFESLVDLHLGDNCIAQQYEMRGLYSFPALKNLWLKGNPILKSKSCKSRRQAELIIDMRELHNIIVKDVSIPDFLMPNEKIAVAERYKQLQESRRKAAEYASNEKIVKFTVPGNEVKIDPFARSKTVDQILAERGYTTGNNVSPSKPGTGTSTGTDFKPQSVESNSSEEYRQLFRNPTEMEKAVWRMLGIGAEQQVSEGQEGKKLGPEGKTFLTSVDNILEKEKTATDELIKISLKNQMSVEQLFDLDSDALDMELPNNIQETVRLLRQALANPSQYWRMLGDFDDTDGLKRQALSEAKKRKPWFLREEAKRRISMEDIQLALRRMDDCMQRVDNTLDGVIAGSLFSPVGQYTEAGKTLSNVQKQYEEVQQRMKRLQQQADAEKTRHDI